jgi:putative ABC transport system substrate-binding protein
MRRREFIGSLIGTAVARPLAASAQQSAIPVIGFLHQGQREPLVLTNAFRQGLSEISIIEGRGVTIENRWAEGQYDRLPALVAELVNRQVAVIAANFLPAALAAKAATQTIPIVFLSGSRPDRGGTRVERQSADRQHHWHCYHAYSVGGQESSQASVIAVLVNPSNPNAKPQLRDLQAEAQILNQQLVVLEAASNREIGSVFATLAERQIGALLVTADGFFSVGRTNSSLWRPVMRCPRCIP